MSTSNCAFINGLVAQVFYIDAKRQFHAYVATRPANYEKEMLNLLVKSLEICFVSSTLNYDHQFSVISNEMRTTNGFSSLSLSLFAMTVTFFGDNNSSKIGFLLTQYSEFCLLSNLFVIFFR